MPIIKHDCILIVFLSCATSAAKTIVPIYFILCIINAMEQIAQNIRFFFCLKDISSTWNVMIISKPVQG